MAWERNLNASIRREFYSLTSGKQEISIFRKQNISCANIEITINTTYSKILLYIALPFIAQTGEGSYTASIINSDFVKIGNYSKMKEYSSIFLNKFF